MNAPRRLQLQFFAVLREQAGCSRLALDTAARTPAELYRELQASRGLSLPAELVRVAVNARYAAMDTPLQAGDHVVFIPPVAGG
ncbi:MoaD/ThiS family protein [Opitutus sp. GAS368]|jgi:molybdopterin synthase sulfur carrier subunit|uniref:MoaD/ThiS family protein n=1 Tax=Opitutus sp. GAS368 TaxID=1882749 RepID=UPI00087C04BA|nr:MoaD/ThiS family protein [Opitutus sp. GAS368]SDS19698.1 molybdopterin synthase sulfur carrier subunit [Opitutus sp. GAS368]